MQQVMKKHSYTASLSLISVWLLYTFIYFFLKSNTLHEGAEYAGVMYGISETVLNISVLWFIISVFKYAAKGAKRVLSFFMISFLLVTLSDAIHILLFNVLRESIPYFSEGAGAGFGLVAHHILYAVCLLSECAAWLTLVYYIFSAQSTGYKTRTYAILTLVLGVIVLIMALTFGWSTADYAALSLGGRIFKQFLTMFYFINFTLAMLCLAISKRRSLFYLSLGYLIIISADLVMKLGSAIQLYGIGTMDTFFVLGLVFMLYGFWNFKKYNDHKVAPINWVSESNIEA